MPILNVKEAVDKAISIFRDIVDVRNVTELRLEEVELSEDGKYWLITLGYDRAKPGDPFAGLLGSAKREFIREYRVLKISSSTGELLSMKIREE